MDCGRNTSACQCCLHTILIYTHIHQSRRRKANSHYHTVTGRGIGSVWVRPITHTCPGDLVLKLEHGGAEETLQNREGGSTADIDRDFLPTAFDGLQAQGDWTLTVSDHAGADTGTLNSWSIRIIPAQ
jgi:subtilisin-like proprotein convertase family protein